GLTFSAGSFRAPTSITFGNLVVDVTPSFGASAARGAVLPKAWSGRRTTHRRFGTSLRSYQPHRPQRVIGEKYADAATSGSIGTMAISPNSSALFSPSEFITQRVETLFESARDDRFEDGVESRFSTGLIEVVERYSNAGVAAIERMIGSPSTNAETVAEALKWMPFVRDLDSHKYRLTLLEGALNSPSARIRDAAGIGLSAMDDAHAIPALELAISQEKFADLRGDLRAVLGQLEARCAKFPEAHK